MGSYDISGENHVKIYHLNIEELHEHSNHTHNRHGTFFT